MAQTSPRLALLALTTCILLALGLTGEAANPLLLYQRHAIQGGEYWRLVTGHLVHLGTAHTLLNLAGLGLILWLFADVWRAYQWILVFILVSLFTSFCLYVFSPGVHYYGGLSGVLHGLLVFGLLPGLCRRNPLALVMIALVAAKLGYEQWAPESHLGTQALIGAPVVGIAHLYGAIGGLLVGLVLIAIRRLKNAA